MIDLVNSPRFTEAEIQDIELKFFGPDVHFNEEQKNVINCFSKQNIQACPGSGKTTTLAAKLLLLRPKLTKNIQGGVCILTHTNVAVETIKERLGAEGAAFYSNYPNFLGTIQSFVNKFLAVPAYKQIYNTSVESIDDEVFYAVMSRRQHTAPNAVSYLSRSQQIDHLGDVSFNIHNFDISKSINDQAPVVGKATTSYRELERLKNSILAEGFLKYDEAYALAIRYLRERPKLLPIFSKRFPLVFLDEMQDTEQHQFALLEKLFGQDSVFQTIGDGNQDIFGNYEDISTNWPRSTTFSISISSRFPQTIANTLQKVGVEFQPLVGKPVENALPTYLIVYNNATIGAVKEKFGELIVRHDLHLKEKPTFKCVGGRKDAGAVNITSYFDRYSRSANKVREYYTTMDDYLNALNVLKRTTRNLKEFKSLLFFMFLQVLKLSAIRDAVNNRLFTSSSFERYLQLADGDLYKLFRDRIEYWISAIVHGNDIKVELVLFVHQQLLAHFGVVPNAALTAFFTDPAVVQSLPATVKHNVYEATHLDQTVELTFDTIHAVKGETHTATLYLETYNRTYDIHKLLPLICGSQRRTNTYISGNKTRMKMAYVAMSRPTDLLCLAVHEDHIGQAVDWSAHGLEVERC